jgi:calmodulin
MAAFSERIAQENVELLTKLAEIAPDEESKTDVLRQLNYELKSRIAKQQKASGEPADPVGLSPKEMKELRKAFAKYDKDGSGSIDAKELAALAEDLAEPLSEEEIDEGMKSMDSSGNGMIEFEEFVNWIAGERDKESHKGMKMRMLKLKMRANTLQKAVTEGLKRAPSFSKEYVEVPDNQVRVTVEGTQGDVPEALTEVDVEFKPRSEEEGRAAMGALGAGDAAACVCVNIELLDGVEPSAEAELQAIYDQVFDMVSGDEMMGAAREKAFISDKPTLSVVDGPDGKKLLQVLACFTLDPFSNFGVDARFIKTLHARGQWAHLVDEVIKEEGNMIDLLALEGLKVNGKVELDRKLAEWLSSSEELQPMIPPEVMPAFAMALTFGSVDLICKLRSVMEVFNDDIRRNLEPYNEMIEEYEDKRYIPAEMLGGLTEKIVQTYCEMGPPIQAIYNTIKSMVAGPHSVTVQVPTAQLAVTTKGLQVLHKFFPTEAEIQSHESFAAGGDDDDEDW